MEHWRPMRRSIAAAALVSVALAACGGSSSTESSPAAVEEPAPEPAGEPAPDDPSEQDDPSEPDAQPDPEPAPEPDTPPGAEAEPEPETDPPLEEPPPVVEEPAPEPEVLWPDDGCSTDNSPTPASAAEGPAPAVEIRPESADSPLPDLAVRRINCKGGWENLRNELPADRPLLVWFWAPH